MNPIEEQRKANRWIEDKVAQLEKKIKKKFGIDIVFGYKINRVEQSNGVTLLHEED
jgi:hypothetical protein